MSSSDEEMMTLGDFLDTQNSRPPPLSLPFLLGLATPAINRQVSGENRPIRERIILVNPHAQSMIVFESSESLIDLFRDFPNKKGQSPATKAAIEALPEVEVIEEGSECSICLGEYEIGGKAKEMPCKHRYHSDCVEKWLGIHGNCPICRYEMPLEREEEERENWDWEDEEGRVRRIGDDIWVSLYSPHEEEEEGERSESGSDPMIESDSEHSSDPEEGDDGSSSIQDMEIDEN